MLGLIDRADDMHSILDVETDATMDWLDAWFQERGGRRGRAQVRTATGGLVYARTRHGTSRAGDPSPHDHVLVANVVEMLDERGGYKGLDSAALRDTVEAATMVGRLHSAARAVALGFTIEPDDGPSGNLRHWRITGVPTEVCDLFSKRSDEIAAYLAATGHDGYRARAVAARESRAAKRDTGVDELMPQWRAELDSIGWSVDRLLATLENARQPDPTLPFPLTDDEIDALAAEVLDSGGDLMARHKIFTRTRLVATVAPRLYGRDPAELDRVVDHILAGRAVVPLLGTGAFHEQAYATVEVLATEQAIADTVERLAIAPGPALPDRDVLRAVNAKENEVGRMLTDGQYDAVRAVCSSGRAVDLVVGVAGSGKTTALDAATTALEDAGYRVVGTSTSGQAARTLGTEAHIESRTTTSLLWRLDNDLIALDDRSVVIVDEAAMTADAHLLRLLTEVEKAQAKVILVGDPRQLSAIGPGGAVASLLDRHPEILTTLDHNVRQRDPAERAALAQLRHGDVHQAVDWYLARGRTALSSNRTEALAGMVEAWAADVDSGHDTALLAWRRDDVRDLNRLARDLRRDQGRVAGPEIVAPGGRRYGPGDQVVMLAPNPAERLVTSERLTVTDVDLPGARLRAVTTDGRPVVLAGDAIDAEHLDHGYALTVHRAQGATYDRAAVLAAGGGRELAYVALSRARSGTTLHTVADDLDQARHDLGIDWTNDQHQRWITDTTTATDSGSSSTPAATPQTDHQRLAALYDDLHHLHAGTGRWHDTPEGNAARCLNEVRHQHDDARHRAASPSARRRDRRSAKREAERLAPVLIAAQARWDTVGEPAAVDIRRSITDAEDALDRAESARLLRQLDATTIRRAVDAASIEPGPSPLDRPPPDREDLGL
ncbi:MAG TPA: AAA family ATPase [Iamia sp.]|nr:AAA family ATPase [Iamia sp.]